MAGGNPNPIRPKDNTPTERGETKLDPSILAAAKGADRTSSVVVKGLLKTAEAERRIEALARKVELAASRVDPRVVVIGGSSQVRPRIRFTTPVRAQYLDLLRQAIPPHKAARQLGASAQAVRDAMKADPEFAQDVRDAREEAAEQVFEVQWRNAMEGDIKAFEAVTKVLAVHIYHPDKQIKVEVTGQIESMSVRPADRFENIHRLEEILGARAALRAAGDQIEEYLIDEAEVLEEDRPVD